jgi:hypothetical protein
MVGVPGSRWPCKPSVCNGCQIGKEERVPFAEPDGQGIGSKGVRDGSWSDAEETHTSFQLAWRGEERRAIVI